MAKLSREAGSEILNAGDRLFYLDLLIFFLFGLRREALPGQTPSDEVHKDNADLF